MGDELVERSHQLAALGDALAATRGERHGVLVLVGGEAGSGKTALLRRFCSAEETTLWGSCDPLFTPRPLGPFLDIARATGGELHELVTAGAKAYQVAAAVIRAAEARPGGVLVVEDLHWADEATVDVLSLLGRRIDTIPALVVATYRDDGLDRFHPARRLLGDLAGLSRVRRIEVPPLSAGAVAVLAAPHGIDPDDLHRATGGNPFFVTEVLAAPGDAIPATVRDAVLARAGRLTGDAATVLEAVSIALPRAELPLLDALVPGAANPLEQCLGSGMLVEAPGGVVFRHELARRAVEQSLSPHRRTELHRRALTALTGTADPARLAHHAEAAGDTEAVLRFAPAAARQAASTGAHREAAAHYELALRFAGPLPAEDRAEMLESRSQECYLTDQMDEAIHALEQAVALWRASGNSVRQGSALTQLSRALWCLGRTAEADRTSDDALRLLEDGPPGPEWAQACSVVSATRLNEERYDETMAWAERALAHGDTAVTVHSLNNIGTMQLLTGRPEGWTSLSRSLALATDHGLDDHVGRAYIHLGWAATRTRAYDFEPWLDRGIKVCQELGLEAWEYYVVVYRARLHLDLGRTEAAVEDAEHVLRSARSVPLLRLLALSVLGLARARRGDRDRWAALDEALALTTGQTELQFLAPVATARAEAAWLDGRAAEVDEITSDVLGLAVERNAAWVAGELAWLRRLAGLPPVVVAAVDPYATQLAGEGRAAAARWKKLGCPYDAALALADFRDEADLRTALAEFHRLGARPAAAAIARRLREHGVRDVPRGPRAETERHPARLTRREAEVLTHLGQGESNAVIATRLYLSEKTVHHHVTAILRKLGVASRGQATSEAIRRGLLSP
ncbi:LuxR C-terminal-related transcriptional regulator [Actinoplanes sp. Pm04-4]|uniref:LuxR C-terminal-related transcriptional regulator n=1 Tax=Paractinoplanes pyxinae TaxID=2997416 RepID=A0ABT4AUZ8_9ACTN|nr:helix-turn-helix transcriptional regulator [Actinoplanes pyxinae]MCY1138063.1 LuxR C-terminal-related transcriptional regulator [Actinoplanes pyxinae]